jgi:hypothetical protein
VPKKKKKKKKKKEEEEEEEVVVGQLVDSAALRTTAGFSRRGPGKLVKGDTTLPSQAHKLFCLCWVP